MKILVPTDFSPPSKIAVAYAAQLAKKLNASLDLLAVVSMNAGSATSIKWKKLEDEMVAIAQQDGDQLIREIRKKVRKAPAMRFHLRHGYPVSKVVKRVAHDIGADMVLMGTKGASGLKKVVMGSNAADVIDTSSVPVITVPAGVESYRIRKIVYATDLRNAALEIKTLALFASLMHARLYVLHVLPSHSAKELDPRKVKAALIKESRYPKLDFTVLHSDRIQDAVNTHVEEKKADLLAMFTHRLDFFEKLFSQSVTRQVAFQSKVPLLTFNKTN